MHPRCTDHPTCCCPAHLARTSRPWPPTRSPATKLRCMPSNKNNFIHSNNNKSNNIMHNNKRKIEKFLYIDKININNLQSAGKEGIMNCKFLLERFIIRWLVNVGLKLLLLLLNFEWLNYNGSDQNFQPIIYSLLLYFCQSGLMQIMSKLFLRFCSHNKFKSLLLPKCCNNSFLMLFCNFLVNNKHYFFIKIKFTVF